MSSDVVKKKHLLPEEREKIFAMHSPTLRKDDDDDEDDDDDLYDESGDETEEGWGSESESSREITPRKPKNITPRKEDPKPSKVEPSPEKIKIEPPQPTTTDAIEISDSEGNSTSESEEIEEESLPKPQEIDPEEKELEQEIAKPTLESPPTPVKKIEEPVPHVQEENEDPEDAYKDTDLFQELLQFKQKTKGRTLTPKSAKTRRVGTEVNNRDKKKLIVSCGAVVPPVVGNEVHGELFVKALPSRQRSGRNALGTHSGTAAISPQVSLRPPVPRRPTRTVKTRSVDFKNNPPLESSDDGTTNKNKKRNSLLVDGTPDNRDLDVELAIDGAPVTPGADYFYSQADLDLLAEMEAREARKQAYMMSVTHEEKEKKTDIKKKLKVASDLLSILKSEDKVDQPFDMAGRNAQLLAAQKIKDKNRTLNLLPEDTSLDPTIRLRNMTINEIVSTERDFKVDLETIVQVFYEPLISSTIIDTQQCSSIFSNISVIYDICKTTVSVMESTIHLPEGPKMSNCFSELIHYHKMYSDYCNNHSKSVEITSSLMKKNSAFRQFIEEAQNQPCCGGLQFVSYLIKPVQRICKYPLLLRELIKHEPDTEEKAALADVLDNISEVVNAINETKRAAENMNKIVQIQKRLICKNVELLVPGRSFVKEGVLQEVTKHGDFSVVYLCLFNDIFIRAEKRKNKFGTMRRNEKMTVTDHAMLYSVKITNVPDCDDYSHAFEIQFSKKKYLICAGTSREKLEWLQALKEQIMNIHRESENTSSKGSHIKQSESRNSPSTPVATPASTPATPATPAAPAAPATPVVVSSDTVKPTDTPDKLRLASSSSGHKIKCYVNKGTPLQRIRKVSLSGVESVEILLERIRSEFEWDEQFRFLVCYVDEDGDVIEISRTTEISEIMEEAKSFLINTN